MNTQPDIEIGDIVELEVSSVAHGGHCVARLDGRVIFVRHTAPGEKIKAEITAFARGGRMAFAETVEVLTPSSHRVTPPCSYAGVCGGCDWQHLDVDYQRQLKTDVVVEQLTRMGKLDAAHPALRDFQVKALRSPETGLGWRTRVGYSTDTRGRAGFHKHSSDEVVAITKCIVAADEVADDGIMNVPWAKNAQIRAVVTSTGEVAVLADADTANPLLTEKVGDLEYRVSAHGFWQAHKDAPAVFSAEVLRLADVQAGDHVLDLYSGAGLFTLPLAQAVGAGGRVEAIEGDRRAAKDASHNAKNFENIVVHNAGVSQWFSQSRLKTCDVIVLDPPRTGAGAVVINKMVRLSPRTIIYVACDPAALSRDVVLLNDRGYFLEEITGWDAFPMTHHVESIAKFVSR
jgi:tRNA/tmRNA/rRNA uracil-C5-methylase (TrmA/RlmC/RlmD family)